MLIPNVVKTWAPVGETPVLEYPYKRDKISLISGVSVSPLSAKPKLPQRHEIYIPRPRCRLCCCIAKTDSSPTAIAARTAFTVSLPSISSSRPLRR